MKVLIMVDMLRGFLESEFPMYCGKEARKIIPIVKRLAGSVLVEDGVILHVKDEHWFNDPEFKVFEKHCMEHSEGAETVPELAEIPWTPVAKRSVDGFYETTLDKWLRHYGCEEAVVVGVCTDICVQYIVAGLSIRDISTTVYKDCVAGFSKETHDAALVHMEKVLGATVAKFAE